MAASDHLNPAQFFHGTRSFLEPGDLVEPGNPKTWEDKSADGMVYFTSSPKDARIWGGGPGRERTEQHFGARETQRHDPVNVYRVEPTGGYRPDSHFPARTHNSDVVGSHVFRAGETQSGALSYETLHPLRVVDEHEFD